MKKIVAMSLIFLIGIFAMGCSSKDSLETKAKQEKETTVADKTMDIKDIFVKEKEVFGIKLYATNTVADDKLDHAVAIMSEYLDNNEDGQIDNPKVVERMVQKYAAMIIFKNPEESEKTMALLEENPGLFKELDALQDLYDSEIHIGGAKEGKFDASYEEILHLITHVGYANVYPEIFGEHAGSEVAKAMDLARGGYFEQVPAKYPENAWYSYDDKTADYGTMVTEYIYWSLTSILGAQEFEGRLDEIQGEWKLNTKDKVKEKDSIIYNLLMDDQYKLPSTLPDGVYSIK